MKNMTCTPVSCNIDMKLIGNGNMTLDKISLWERGKC